MRTLPSGDLAWRVKGTWAEPEGMLATFHVFYEITIAVLKCRCVQKVEYAAPCRSSFVPPMRNAYLGMRSWRDYAYLKLETERQEGA